MSHPTTFEEIERCAGTTGAYVLFVRYAKSGAYFLFAAVLIVYIAKRLRRLISIFSPRLIEQLTEEQFGQAFSSLETLHTKLIEMLERAEVVRGFDKLPVFGRSIKSIRESTENLEDVLEDLTLLHDQEFKGLISDAIRDLTPSSSKTSGMPNHLEAVQN